MSPRDRDGGPRGNPSIGQGQRRQRGNAGRQGSRRPWGREGGRPTRLSRVPATPPSRTTPRGRGHGPRPRSPHIDRTSVPPHPFVSRDQSDPHPGLPRESHSRAKRPSSTSITSPSKPSPKQRVKAEPPPPSRAVLRRRRRSPRPSDRLSLELHSRVPGAGAVPPPILVAVPDVVAVASLASTTSLAPRSAIIPVVSLVPLVPSPPSVSRAPLPSVIMALVMRFARRGGKDRPGGGGGHRLRHAVEPQNPSDHHQWLIAPTWVGSVQVTRVAIRPRPFEEVEFGPMTSSRGENMSSI